MYRTYFRQYRVITLAIIPLLINIYCQCALADEPAEPQVQDCVILLHGLARTSKSMRPLANALTAANYIVVNQDYPSRHFAIAHLAAHAIPSALDQCRTQAVPRIHFITHSLGGILLRQYLVSNTIPELGRVVMFAPPNKGSQVVDKLKKVPGFMLMNGPAGQELGTDAQSVPMQLAKLGPVNFDLGVIAGTRSINLLLSMYLPNPDDGKVSLENTKVEGMRDFIALPVSHPFIMKDKNTIRQSLHYLQEGKFIHDEKFPVEKTDTNVADKKTQPQAN